jgi:hypothetical protein
MSRSRRLPWLNFGVANYEPSCLPESPGNSLAAKIHIRQYCVKAHIENPYESTSHQP